MGAADHPLHRPRRSAGASLLVLGPMRRVLAPVFLACWLLATSATVAWAFPLHVFSWATENSGGRGYTGLKEYRKIVSVYMPYCATVYQTMWVNLELGATNDFLELGTHHSCSGITSFYGYNVGSTFYFLDDWSAYNTVGTWHHYRIDQESGDYVWKYFIDGNELPISLYFDGGATALQLSVVLETYESTANVPTHSFKDLQMRRWQGGSTLVDWSGRDATHVDPQYGVMCGAWVSDTQWSVAENNSC